MRMLVTLALTACCGLAHAQAPMYRSTMPDGRTVISDQPMRGAKKVEELKPAAGNYAPGAPPPPGAADAAGQTLQRRAEARRNVEQAQREYEEALARQAKGREEGPGDRIGVAKGGARLTDSYYERQAALEREVEAARKRVEEAQQAARNVQ